MQTSNFEKVGDFMEAVGQAVRCEPTFPDPAEVELRVILIAEEFQELIDAIKDKDIIEVADALTDILYVVYGTGHSFGIDLDECFKEVHDSNNSKLDENGRPIYAENGKVLKGPNYRPPNLTKILNISDT